jgi:hypothetical protein
MRLEQNAFNESLTFLLSAMSGRLFERWQIALFGQLLQLMWRIRKGSLAVERRLLRAGVWLTDPHRSKHGS